jgi:hypothetical protein
MSDPSGAVRRREPERILFDLLLVAFFATFVISSLSLRSDSALVPLIVGVPALAAMAVRTMLDIRGTTVTAAAPHGEAAAPDVDAMATGSLTDLARAARDLVDAEADVEAAHQESRRQRVFAVWAVAVVLLPMLATEYLQPLFGLRTYFLPGAALGLLVITRWVGLSWLRSITVTAGVIAFMYVMLGVLLGVRL